MSNNIYESDDEQQMSMSSSSEEDDEVLLIFPMLHHMSSFSEKRPCYTSVLTGSKWIEETLEGHEDLCKFEFRMDCHIFRALANVLRDKNLLRDTMEVRVEEQLAILLFTLAHNASNRDLRGRFQHSGETIHRHFKSAFKAVLQLVFDYIKPPASTVHPRIRSDPRFWPYFEDCIGAIDGTHIPVSVGEKDAAPYRNRKSTLSQNVMLTCDFNYHFTYISTGWEGSASVS